MFVNYDPNTSVETPTVVTAAGNIWTGSVNGENQASWTEWTNLTLPSGGVIVNTSGGFQLPTFAWRASVLRMDRIQ